MSGSALRDLALRAGIESGYQDTWGNHHATSDATLRALLHAMGLPATTDGEAHASLARLDAIVGMAPPRPETATRAWQPDALAGGARRWGLAVQLYGLRTARTWGIGDFSALSTLVEGAAALGACAIGINPVHALFPTRPGHASPYSPNSRRFVNPLYLDVTAIDDFAGCEAARRLTESADFQARLHAARAATLVEYAPVASLKYQVLSEMYAYFCKHVLNSVNHPHARSFRRFQDQEGPSLRRFATFQALAAERTEIDWRQWPDGLGDPDSPAVAAFAAQHGAAIGFHEYLQWQAARQLQAVNAKARACAMSIGLYSDLAVGADPTGAECWEMQAVLARGVTIGAPPDALNLAGQNWGLPPPDPFALRAAACAPMSGLWRQNMRHAGALRIDHILGLMRLYWIPAGASASEGAYVRYPWKDLFGVLAAASRRSRCMVIGEDLGTVPAGLRDTMRSLGMLSYHLLYFEQHNGRFNAPHEYPSDALVAVGTHDLPPLPMWWNGQDIALRDALGLWPNDAMRQAEVAARQHDREALTAALRDADLHAGDVPQAAPVDAIYTYLARTPCKLLMVQLEDVLDVHVQANVPGTTDQHPNWQRRLPCSVDALLADPRVRRIAAALNAAGRDDR